MSHRMKSFFMVSYQNAMTGATRCERRRGGGGISKAGGQVGAGWGWQEGGREEDHGRTVLLIGI